MHRTPRLLPLALGGLMACGTATATNPLILDQFTADPTARVFEDRVYVYPSHDILATPGKGRPGWFCMEDYHVFSSENLTDWTDHGVIVTQTNVPWVNPTSYSMWAPDCVFKNGRYYFYFPATARGGGMTIGVAVADKPYGPFTPEAAPIKGVRGIDPCVLIDRDGSAYLYYSLNRIFVAKLKDNMLELDSEPQVIANLPTAGLLEGPFVFERSGTYYLTYPHVANKIERLEYATATNAMGPFKQTGVILDESPSGCWTVHHSLVEYQGQWYLFYHDRDLSPQFDKNRSMRADRLWFNADGTIQKVVPTLRGVGTVDARSTIQIDRYSAISPEGAAVSFLSETNTHDGWKISLSGSKAWVRFDDVEFGKGDLRVLTIRATASAEGQVLIHLDNADGPVLARVHVGPDSDWQTVGAKLLDLPSGKHGLYVTTDGKTGADIDWIRFQ